jgi:Pre-toxin TG
VIEIPGIGSDAIHELRDELLHWLRRYEEKLNEAEELLYRTAASIRQADQTLADNIKEFGLELLGWYDVQRLFGEYDPVTGERISGWDRLIAGGMLLLSVIPPAKGAGIAGKAGIKGAKAAETAVDVSKLVSQTKNVLNYNKIKPFFQTIYHQVIKGPITETIRSFKHQWENFLENVGSVLRGPQLAADGVGVVPSGRVIGIVDESASSARFSMSQVGEKGTGDVAKGTGKTVDDLIKVAKPGRATKGRTIQYELSGGFSEAMNDFHSLGPKITKDTPDLKVGILKDGRTVIVRKRSSDGRPTLEIQDGKKRIKFRY